VSNFLAPATVSAALQLHLTDAVKAAVGGAEVWVDRSDVKRQKAGVNIYLYRTSVDPIWRNQELPARRDDASLRNRPRAAANLHYLLTFHGKDDELVPQRLLGATLAALHTRPILSRELIDQVVDGATDTPPSHPYLAFTDLAEADEVVRLSPDPLDLDELSKLWSVFFQTPYQLSTTYLASSVLIEEQEGTVLPAPPVLAPQLTVRPRLQPTILSARNAADPRAAVVASSTLAIAGSGLRGDVTSVRVGPEELSPVDAETTATEIHVGLTAATGLRAGLQPVVVAHRWLVGDPAEQRGGEISNAVGVFVSPTISASVAGGVLTVTSDLVIGVRQQVSASLLVPATGSTARVLDGPERTTDTTDVDFQLSGVPAGQYAVRLQVDGAESPVTRNASGTITDPLVTVP
jgi:hypothetical protein